MNKFIFFDADGILKARYDGALNPHVPEGAIPVSDALFLRTVNEFDGVWMINRESGEISKQPLPVRSRTHDDIWTAIKALRAEKEAGGIRVEQAGDTFWLNSDAESRMKLMHLLAEAESLPEGMQWKTLENEFVTLTPEMVKAISGAMLSHSSVIFAAAELHREAMMALDDPTHYDYSTGWPETYAEQLAREAAEEAARATAEAEAARLADAAEATAVAAVEARAMPVIAAAGAPDSATSAGENALVADMAALLVRHMEAEGSDSSALKAFLEKRGSAVL